MSDSTDDATVDVHVEVPTPEPVVEATHPEPTTDTPEVHVHHETTPDIGVHPTVAEFMQSVTRELQELRGRTEGAETHASSAHDLATEAQGAVGSAIGDVQAIAEELTHASQDSVVPSVSPPTLDSDPHKPHLWFRPAPKLRRHKP